MTIEKSGRRYLVALMCMLTPLCVNAEPASDAKKSDWSPEGKRIVFVGDSITQSRHYVIDIKCWLLVNGIKADVISLGLASETATELTKEENAEHLQAHGFGYPWIGVRFPRILAETNPNMLVICYGMNDSGGLPEGKPGTERYGEAITKLRQEALDAGVERVLVCTPPIFDNRKPNEPNIRDAKLASYTKWLLEQRKNGWEVANIYTPMRTVLDTRRKREPAFALAGDGVHPGREGHWIMAQAILYDGFGAKNIGKIPSADALFANAEQANAFRQLLVQQNDVLFAAYMTKIRHGRPHVYGGLHGGTGPSIDEATRQSADIDERIQQLVNAAKSNRRKTNRN